MLRAARGLVRLEFADISDDPDQIVDEFRTRFFDTQKFFDPFAGGKFAQYLFAAHRKSRTSPTRTIPPATASTKRTCSSRPRTVATSASARHRRRP